MIRLIACDIDGTLLRGTQREISPAVFREVVRLGKQGVRFCPASGRQYHSLRGLFAPIASRLHYVCENGAVVFGPGDPGPILAKETMEREQALELCREILDMDGCEVLISGAGISYLCPKEGDIVDHVRYFVGNRTALVDRPEEITEDIVKVSAYCRRGAAEAEPVLAPRWRRIWRVAVAGEKWLDFTAADKGKGVRALCRALGIGPEQVLAVGDNYNDVPMLELAGEPWIMEGADPELLRRFPLALCPGGGCAGADRTADGELSGRFLLHMENQEPPAPV